MQLCKIQNQVESTLSTKNSNTPCAHHVDVSHYPLLLSPGVLFLVQFSNFDQTTGVTHSYSSHPALAVGDQKLEKWKISEERNGFPFLCLNSFTHFPLVVFIKFSHNKMTI